MKLLPLMACTIILAALLPSGTAQSLEFPDPPETIIGFVFRSDIYTSSADGGTSYDAEINWTFPRSAQDDGTFDYDLYSTLPDGSSIVQRNVGVQDVPSRPGWVFLVQQIAATDNGTWSFNFTANNTATRESAGSCQITMTLRVNATLEQCGTAAAQPSGFSGITTNATIPGTVGTIRLTWQESANDTDDEWRYRIGVAFREDESLTIFEFAGMNVPHTGSQRTAEFPPSGLGLNEVWMAVQAYDNLTRWRSPVSCEIFFNIGINQSSDFCGNMTAPVTTFPGAIDGGGLVPQYPFVNLTQLSDSMGVDIALTGTVLGFGSVAGLALAGLVFGGFPLAIILGTLGLAAVTAMLLIGTWWIILAFMAAIAIILFLRPSGGLE